MWHFVRNDDAGRILVGNGGFKVRPVDGRVEIGYSIVPDFQGHGYATEAVTALVDWAFAHPIVNRVVAETLPELEPSKGLLHKLGFIATKSAEPGILRYERWRR